MYYAKSSPTTGANGTKVKVSNETSVPDSLESPSPLGTRHLLLAHLKERSTRKLSPPAAAIINRCCRTVGVDDFNETGSPTLSGAMITSTTAT
jgi:hypothetical protein